MDLQKLEEIEERLKGTLRDLDRVIIDIKIKLETKGYNMEYLQTETIEDEIKMIEAKIREVRSFAECETCGGSGNVETCKPYLIEYGKNAGTLTVDVETCPDCKGTGAGLPEYVALILKFQEEIKELKKIEEEYA